MSSLVKGHQNTEIDFNSGRHDKLNKTYLKFCEGHEFIFLSNFSSAPTSSCVHPLTLTKSYNETQMDICEITNGISTVKNGKIIRTWRREKGFSEILSQEISVETYSKIPQVVDCVVRPRELRALQDTAFFPGLFMGKATESGRVINHLSVAHNTSILLMATVIISPSPMRTIKQRGL